MSSSGTLCMRTPQVALERRYSMHMHTVGVCVHSVCAASVRTGDVWTLQLKKHSQLLNLGVFKKLR